MACINVKSTSDAIRAITDSFRSGSNWQDVLSELSENTASEIKARVNDFINRFEAAVGIKLEEYLKFNKRTFFVQWRKLESELLSEFNDNNDNPYAEIDKTTNDIKLEFGSNDPGGYDRVNKAFRNSIADSSIFHIEYNTNDASNIVNITSPLIGNESNRNNLLNKNIHSYKINLLKKIKAYTDFEIDSDYGLNDASFTKMITNALSLFEHKYDSDTTDSEEKQDAHDAYVTLKYFDVFLKDIDFIDTIDAYKKSASYSPNMYQYIGPANNLPSHWGKDEIQNASIVNSSIISLIFDNMPVLEKRGNKLFVKNQTVVGSGAFMGLMAKFKSWLLATGETEILRELDTDALSKKLDEFIFNHIKSENNFIPYKTKYIDKLVTISEVLKSAMDQDTLRMIWKHFATNDSMQYLMYLEKDGSIHGQEGKQNIISLQEIKILDRIRNAVLENKILNPEGFKELCENYGIRIKGRQVLLGVSDIYPNGRYRLTLDTNNHINVQFYYPEVDYWANTDEGVTIGSKNSERFLEPIDVDGLNQWVKPMIEQLLGMIPDGWQQYTSDNNLLDLFSQALGTTFLAISGSNTGFQFNKIGADRVEYLNTNHNAFRGDAMQNLAEMFAAAYGADTTVTLQNLNGDSIPAFSLTSLIHGYKKIRNKLGKEAKTKGVKNALSSNFVYSNYLKVGEPYVRRDAQIAGTNTQAVSYSENEVTYLGIMCDFYESLYDSKNNSILFQNTTNSDKGTHWVIPYGKDIIVGRQNSKDVTLETALKEIISGDVNGTYRSMILNTLYDCRRGEYLNIASNLIRDYEIVLGTSYGDMTTLEAIEDIARYVNTHKLSEIKQLFKETGIEWVNNVHFATKGGFNNSFLDELRLYCGESDKLFKSRMNQQLNYFIDDLTNGGFELNVFDDANVAQLMSKLPESGKNWVDTKTGDLLLKQDGKANPFLQAYFLADVLLSTEFNKMTTGFYWMHDSKYSPTFENGDFEQVNGKYKTIDERTVTKRGNSLIDESGNTVEKSELVLSNDYYVHDAAKRLAASYKRTVINGASIELYTPQERGIGTEFTYIAVDDIPGTVWNMVGEQDSKLKSMDGAAFVHPVFAMLCGWSSLSGKVTYDNKTICGDLSAKFGLPTLFKWAEFGLTNHRRRMGYMSDASVEHAYEIMSSIPLNQYIKLENYYSYGRNINSSSEKIYKRDPFSKKNYLVHNISTSPKQILDENGNVITITECTYSLTEVDNTGKIIGNAQRVSKDIRTLYDIDQILGGAYSMRNNDGKLEYYDGNVSTLAEVVCGEHLKDKLVAYIINDSATKDGNRNVNGSDLFNNSFARTSDGRIDFYNNVLTSTCSTINLGKQMDPDHELEFAEVSEMSQMISALIQGGHFTKLVNQIYKEIGKVAAQSMRLTLNALSKNDENTVYKLLGESLMSAFETGNRNTTGLAQSFLIKAAKALKDENIKYEIPFSGPTINATFISDVVSSINKKGIRRKYSGIASVLVPSHNMIQTFRINGKTMMFDEAASEISKLYPRTSDPYESPEDSIQLNKQHFEKLLSDVDYAMAYGAIQEYNPGIKPDMEDTVVIETLDENGNTLLDNGKPVREVVKIDNYDDFDRVRNLLPKNTRISNWTVKPKNLRQLDVTFQRIKSNGDVDNSTSYSMYDLDSVRALHYLRNVKEMRKLSRNYTITDPFKIQTLKLALYRAGIEWDGKTIPFDLNQWQRLLNLQVKSDLAALDTTHQIGIQTSMIRTLLSDNDFEDLKTKTCTVTNVNTRHAEMIMGRLHAVELGLEEGDDINTIQEQGDDFFYNKLIDKQTITTAKNVYDYVVTTNTGHTIYVAVRDKHSKKDLSPYHTENKSFTHTDTGLWYNREDQICDKISNNCKVVSIQNDKKQVCPFIIVDSEDEASILLSGEGINFVHYNVTPNNINVIANRLFGNNVNITLRLDRRNNIQLTQDLIDNFGNLSQEQQDQILAAINSYVRNENNKKVKKLAHKQYLAFEEQLNYVGARIPTQSMQSFQRLKLVGFSDSLKNEVYVPKVQTWLQGSDYDIDKLYIMSYKLAKDGTLSQFSKLINESDLKSMRPILELNSPNGKFYTEGFTNIDTIEPGTYDLTDSLSLMKRIWNDESQYIIYDRLTNESVTFVRQGNIFTITDRSENLGRMQGLKLFKSFIEYCPPNSEFISDGDAGNNQLIDLITRTNHVIETSEGLIKRPRNLFGINNPTSIVVTKADVIAANNFKSFRIFNDIMESGSTFIRFEEDVTPEQRQEFLRLLNEHTQGKENSNFTYNRGDEPNITEEQIQNIIDGDTDSIKDLPRTLTFDVSTDINTIYKVKNQIEAYQSDIKIPDKTGALQNSVLAGILNLLDKRTIQTYGHNPISTDDLKALVDPDPVEMRMSMDNPYVKFMMQVQNMVGKSVIGITAVSMKVFFAASTYMNNELDAAVEAYQNGDDTQFAKHLANTLFVDYSSGNPEINTMANLNLDPLKRLLKFDSTGKLIKDVYIPFTYAISKVEQERLRPAIAKYLVNGKISLNALLNGNNARDLGLIKRSQSQDAAQNISELLSAATDNAKELILAKINATSEFADIWGMLLMTGHSFEEIKAIMQSPYFNTVAKLSKAFGMSKIHRGVTSKNIINFIALDGNLPSINAKALKYAVGAFPSTGLNNCFFYKLRYETDNNGNLLTFKNGKKVPITSSDKKEDLIKRSTPIYFFKPINGILTKTIVDDKYIDKLELSDSETYKEDYKYWLTSNDAVNIFDSHLRSLLPNKAYDELFIRFNSRAYNEEYEDFDDYDDYSSDVEQDFDDFEDAIDIPVETLNPGSEEDNRTLLRYTRKFLKARANLYEQNSDSFNLFANVVANVLPITEEQNIVGMELGVNQGIPTNEFDFYNKLLRIENFINKAYGDNADFDIIQFIEDEDYREHHIAKYEAIKKGLNPLAIISRVPNFAQMFKFYGTANKLLGRSAQFKLDFALAKTILNGDNTKRLNAKEFKALHNGVKDSLILNWLKQADLKITLPQNQLIYLPVKRGSINTYYTPVKGLEIDLGTISGLATFKHLMDHYVFPKLKNEIPDNLFVRMIDSSVKINRTHQQLSMRKRMPIDMMRIDESAVSKDQFNAVMKSFGEIAKNTEFLKKLGISDGSLTLGDVIYLYNLYTYKDSFGHDSFTRVFEIMNVYNDKAKINDFYTWLAKLDKGLSRLSSLENPEHFTIDVDGEQIGIDVKKNDLLYRMLGLENIERRLGVTALSGNNGLYGMQYTDLFGNVKGQPLNVRCKDASDFCMELPFSIDDSYSDDDLKEMGFTSDNIELRIRPNDREVINQTMDAIDDACNIRGDFVIEINNKDLEMWQNDPQKAPIDLSNQDMLKRVCSAHGFVYGGKIYINTDIQNYKSSTKVHELGHAVCAMLKFGTAQQQNSYYELINAAISELSENKLKELAQIHGFKDIHNSDFKEEVFVDLLAEAFKKGIDSSVFANGNRFSHASLQAKIRAAVNSMFGINIDPDIKLEKIGNSDITAILAMFGNYAREFDYNTLMPKLEQSAQQRAFKQSLTVTSKSEFEHKKNGIYYDC